MFSMLEIQGNCRCAILQLVKRRNKDTLVPIIKKHVKRQSMVVSDEWRYVKVNESQNYVDPSKGLHTQNIKRAWQIYKKEGWCLHGN